MQHLYLARHGNTFSPGQKSVWVGARNDLPLVEKGEQQAKALANYFKAANLYPDAIYCASLQRTKKYAEIVRHELGVVVPTNVDTRLNELDYGDWSGLSNEEIKEKFGAEELKSWNEAGKWSDAFNGEEAEIIEEVKTFVRDFVIQKPDNKMILAVTSNGRLKYFLKLLPDLYSEYMKSAQWKVATGNYCVLSYHEQNWRSISWNANPASVSV